MINTLIGVYSIHRRILLLQLTRQREPWPDPSGNGIEDRLAPQSSHLPNIYSSLSPLVGEIRILEIESGTFHADTKYRMRAWPANGEGYTALSYVWGEDPPTKAISVNGKCVTIRKNLDSAIRYIRDENEPLRLWVDAICINQQDLSERTSQVEMMSEIYQQAQSLTVFLGEGNEDLSELFTFIQDINDDITIDQVLGQADTPRVLDQFWQLLQMPWWSRIWIIQEFAYGCEPNVRVRSSQVQC
ncbi:hypothetical protein LCI18_007736 [Fusarium solani-melongenae]|uniref:Uncharacterized protein n=1 Tax=Fusarium solani subsp. cucurbitae TaxID=2747967 RepID=A0ACD3Z7I1_FUSSC|nr:hypothetical protein LCI18_007736 [Fusarium solani-melongenae]